MTNATVFISYSHKDESFKDKLVTHLGVLQQEGLLDIWEDRRIEAGEDWYKKIEEAIQAARVAILLVSIHFLNSKFILGEEVPRLLKKSKEEGLVIFPVIISPCLWKRVGWLAQMNLRPKDGRPISGGDEYQIDTDMVSIAEEIAAIILKEKTLITAKPEKSEDDEIQTIYAKRQTFIPAKPEESGEDEVEKQLLKLIFEHGSAVSKRRILTVGETWEIAGGWTLTAQSVDCKVSPRLAWLILKKDGIKIEEKIVAEDRIYSYVGMGETGTFMLATYIDAIFSGATSDFVIFISAEPKTITSKDDVKLMKLILDHKIIARPEKFGENEIEKELIKLIFNESDVTNTITLGVGGSYWLSWDENPRKTGEKLIEVLKGGWRFGWIDNTAKIDIIDDKTIKISTENNSMSLKLNDEKTKACLRLDDGTIYEFTVVKANGELKLYEDVWDIGDGWILIANSVDAKTSPKQVLLMLYKDDIKKEDIIAAEDTIYTYVNKNMADELGIPSFAVYIDTVFSGATSDLVAMRFIQPKKLQDNKVKNELNKLINEIETTKKEKKILVVGETWLLDGGWSLTANSIDAKVSPRKAWLTLSKDGNKKEEIVVVAGKIYKYVENTASEIDVPLFETFIDAVFAGSTTDLVQFSIGTKSRR